MGDQVSWHVESAVRPGQLDSFRVLTSEMVESTRGEAGVLSYERFVSDDGKVVHVYERYIDSEAAVAHLLAFRKKFGERFEGLVDRKRFTVYGTPSNELKELLDAFGAQYLAPLDGFSQSSGVRNPRKGSA